MRPGVTTLSHPPCHPVRSPALPLAEVFTDANLERSPTKTFQPPNSTLVATTAIQLDQTGNPAFLELLGRLKTFFAVRGIDVKSLFSEFDNHNSGLVSASQFRRQLPAGLALSDADVETLLSTLGRDGAVDYQALKNRESPPHPQHTRATHTHTYLPVRRGHARGMAVIGWPRRGGRALCLCRR